jgi:hypothetical protein
MVFGAIKFFMPSDESFLVLFTFYELRLLAQLEHQGWNIHSSPGFFSMACWIIPH